MFIQDKKLSESLNTRTRFNFQWLDACLHLASSIFIGGCSSHIQSIFVPISIFLRASKAHWNGLRANQCKVAVVPSNTANQNTGAAKAAQESFHFTIFVLLYYFVHPVCKSLYAAGKDHSLFNSIR